MSVSFPKLPESVKKLKLKLKLKIYFVNLESSFHKITSITGLLEVEQLLGTNKSPGRPKKARKTNL